MLDFIANFIVRHRNIIGKAFIILVIISTLLIPTVVINYDLSEYVPDTEQAKRGMNIVDEEFGMQGMARIMLNDVTLVEAKAYKDKIQNIDGVDSVVWLDDLTDINQPVEFISKNLLEDYYKDGSALLEILFSEDDYSKRTNKAIDEIKNIVPEGSQFIGSAVDTKSAQDTIKREVIVVMAILIPVVIIILLLTTTSFLSPVLFLTVIGASILLNMGTNVIFDSVSFVTYSIVAALQLAISMDYSVFMLHEFEVCKKNEPNPEKAMVQAIKKGTVISCALATTVGFISLTFMTFGIGKDMGWVFAKGIFLSLLSVIFLMPYLILKFYDKIEKTAHKPFMPSFERLFKISDKLFGVIVVIILIIVVPAYVAQKNNDFKYGSSAFGGGEGTQVYEDEKKVREKFGRSSPVILMVPSGDYVSEKKMSEELEDINTVRNVRGLVTLVSEGIPDSFVPSSVYNKFKNKNYSRMIVYMNTASESELAFNSIQEIKKIASKYYGDNYEITGNVPITEDIRDVVNKDYNIVDLLSMVAVGVVVLITFRSLSLPVILVLAIETGIFINMAVPYYTNQSLIFLGYLIVSQIQLGATIDYAILLTNNYMDFRKDMDKKEAAHNAAKISLPAIFTSGSILAVAGFLLKWESSISAVSEMGDLIGRGALINMFLVIFFLPHMLRLFDGVIQKTTLSLKFKKKERR